VAIVFTYIFEKEHEDFPFNFVGYCLFCVNQSKPG